MRNVLLILFFVNFLFGGSPNMSCWKVYQDIEAVLNSDANEHTSAKDLEKRLRFVFASYQTWCEKKMKRLEDEDRAKHSVGPKPLWE